jgi:preprotein translocase subunit SecE
LSAGGEADALIELLRTRNEMARTNPFEFLQQVRTEVSKVTWPTRRETVITTIMVLVMVIAAALFFLAADQVLSFLVSFVLGIGR